MRVEVLTSSWPSHPGDPGGHFVAASVAALRAAGARVHVRTLFSGIDHANLPTRAWSAARPAPGGALGWARRNPVRALGLAGRSPQFFAGLRGADRVVCHWAWPMPLLAQAAGVRSACLRTVCHGSALRTVRTFGRAALGRAHPLAVVSEHQLLDLPRAWRPVARVLPVPVAAPTAAAAGRQRVVVFVGRLIASKGVGDLPALLDLLPDWRACVVGAGPLRAALQADQRIDCLGALPADRWPAAIPRGVGWIPSRQPEGSPLVVDELRRAGCPVVASSSIGLCSRIRPGVDGWLVNGGDLSRYAARIEEAYSARQTAAAVPRSATWGPFVDWVLTGQSGT